MGRIAAVVVILLIIAGLYVGCSNGFGKNVKNAELIGQVKKVQPHTPIICPEWDSADVSLGIMNNGVGSYSNQDIWLTVPTQLLPQFKEAVESGRPVKVTYDSFRYSFCTERSWVTGIEYLPLK